MKRNKATNCFTPERIPLEILKTEKKPWVIRKIKPFLCIHKNTFEHQYSYYSNQYAIHKLTTQNLFTSDRYCSIANAFHCTAGIYIFLQYNNLILNINIDYLLFNSLNYLICMSRIFFQIEYYMSLLKPYERLLILLGCSYRYRYVWEIIPSQRIRISRRPGKITTSSELKSFVYCSKNCPEKCIPIAAFPGNKFCLFFSRLSTNGSEK